MATGGDFPRGWQWRRWPDDDHPPPSLPASHSQQPLYTESQLRGNVHRLYKDLLLEIFDHMDNEEYKSFQNRLDGVRSRGNRSIPRRRIMDTDRQGMPHLILSYFPRKEALEVMKRLLLLLPNMELYERIEQFTNPEPGTIGYLVLEIKHEAVSERDYIDKCQDVAAALDRIKPGMGNAILDEVSQRECVLAKYLVSIKELALERPKDVLKTASEECRKELRRLGVIYLKIEDVTLFTGELHGDPRTWDPVEVTQWVAMILLPRDQTATIPDLQTTGAEICARPETWFTDKFPPGIGRVLYSNLQQRRDNVAQQRKFGSRAEEYERVMEGTRTMFLMSAYLMSMILLLLGQREWMAERILSYMRPLIEIIKRRAKDKKNIHSGHFNPSWARYNILEERRSLSSFAASVVFGSRAIAISSEAYSQVVTSVVEAMEVIGAPLEIKIKLPWWKRVAVAGVVAVGAAATTVAFVVAGPLALVITGIIAAAAIYGANQFLVVAFDVLVLSEKKTAVFKVNYLQALILLPKVVRKEEMTEEELGRIVHRVKGESGYRTIRAAEKDAVETVYRISSLGLGSIPSTTQSFNYRAKEWLQDDSILNVNDTMIIAHAHFELRRLLRDEFVLGVVGSEHSGKTTLVKSVLPQGERSAHHTTTCPYDVKLYDGSTELEVQPLPVLAFPSGQRKEVEAAHGLCIGICTAFICVVEYKTGSPDIGALDRVKDLSVPVLLCVNKCGGLKDHTEASQILDSYKSKVSRDFRRLDDLTEVVLTDFHTPGHDRPAWLTGAEGVKYWIKDTIQNHKNYVSNA